MSAQEPGEAELRACIRDLTSLLALPALWSGRDASTIAAILFEALEAVLPAQVCYLCERHDGSSHGAASLRVEGRAVELAQPEWRAFVHACHDQSQPVSEARSPIGNLRIARSQMSLADPQVTLWVGSRASDFPSATQQTYLLAAASLAATGLQTARLLEEREQADRAKDEFLAMLGHELRNPLSPITTALSLMELKRSPEVDYERQLIARQVKQLSRIVDDLLDVARVSTGKIELRKERLEVHRVVAEALESVYPMLEQRRHALRIDVPAGMTVQADPSRLQQIIANLLGNAAKYTDPGGRIEVAAAREGARIRLEVRDSGMGIDADLLPHVFDLFTQGRTAPDRAGGGLGIGLALVRTLVTLHGGLVRADSPGPGAGSTFTVWLPAAGEARASDSASGAAAAPAGQRRILVVDDNQDHAESMAILLKMLGQDVRVANDGAQALALADEWPPALVLLDIGLPGMDGYEVARRMAQRMGERRPRLVAMTGYGQPQDRRRSREAGMEEHLIKPIGYERLVTLLHEQR